MFFSMASIEKEVKIKRKILHNNDHTLFSLISLHIRYFCFIAAVGPITFASTFIGPFRFFLSLIYPPDSQESDIGAIHKVSNCPDLLPEMPRYCCPLVIS